MNTAATTSFRSMIGICPRCQLLRNFSIEICSQETASDGNGDTNNAVTETRSSQCESCGTFVSSEIIADVARMELRAP